jgi:ribosome-associated translation inhibitor RaiA
MIGVIPNPKKKISIDFPISQVKEGVSKISKVAKKYKIFKENNAFNQFTFEASEFLSLGVFIDVNLSSQGENRTDVEIEVKRKLGAFDTWVEVQNANEHIDKLVDILSKTLTLDDSQLVETAKEEKGVPTWAIILGIIIGLGILGNL